MKTLLASIFVLALACPSFANQCPSLVKQIDEKLQSAQLSDADKAKVTELRNKGEEQHAAGDHAASEASLNEALAMLD
ncbi:hypothetical protein [Mesorhizobium sp. WSM2239]|uniref:Uncharacterized protein n=2 Tax=unclassified Mesorhizobium TaxID=325217 RepID=A0AAU8DCL6_9HYPH